MNSLHIFSDLVELRRFLQSERNNGRRIGLVPTMGALHAGHLSLVKKATKQSDCVVVSIFVNPTQFGPGEDFSKYPRPLEQDIMLLRSVGAPVLFVPNIETMYPEKAETLVDVGSISHLWEGEHRPGHFRGVATIVLKLLNIVGPDYAFFGQKDFQQVCVIQKMVEDLNVPVELVICPTIREPDGLAMSSRNQYLSPKERADALVLSQSLHRAKQLFRTKQTNDLDTILDVITDKMRKIILSVNSTVIDYIALVDPQTLQPLKTVEPSQEILALVAVRVGTTRLIDNAFLS